MAFKVKGVPFRISVGAQARFTSKINQPVEAMVNAVNSAIEKLYKSEPAMTHMQAFEDTAMDAATVGSQSRILLNAFQRQFQNLFGALATTLAQQMVADINQNSTQQSQANVGQINLVNQGAALSLDPKLLDAATIEILKASVNRAADFIRSIPDKYLSDVSAAVYNSIQNGNGLQDLQPYLEKYGSTVKNWAHNTAMDQTRKTFNSLNASRMRQIGVRKGEWLHSGGSQHPRPLHVEADGKTFDLNKGLPVGDNGGDYVMPGDDVNCRCTFTPILDDLLEKYDVSNDDEENQVQEETPSEEANNIVSDAEKFGNPGNDIPIIENPKVSYTDPYSETLAKTDIKWTKNATKNAELAGVALQKLGVKTFIEARPKSVAAAIGSPNNGILINKSHKFWKDPVTAMLHSKIAGHNSTSDPRGVLVHEMAHLLYDTRDNWFGNEKEIAKQVSNYATTNPHEFVSEVSAGVNTGVKYSPEVMNLFKLLAKPMGHTNWKK